MGQTLEALHRLQAVELQMAGIRQAREAKARRVEKCKRLTKTAEEKLESNRLIIRNNQMQLDALQLDVATREEAINKHRQALNSAKTNKEYAAILTALNTEKADTAKLETEMLRLMEEVQSHKDEAAGIELEQGKQLEDVARAEKELGTFDVQSRPQRDELQAKRDECANEIEPTTLSTFLRVAEHHDGEAMVPISKVHPKRDEYICSGCNMMVTLEVVNTLFTRGEVQQCKVCGRILYLDMPKVERSRA